MAKGDAEDPAGGLLRLLAEERRRIQIAIKVADDFKMSAGQRCAAPIGPCPHSSRCLCCCLWLAARARTRRACSLTQASLAVTETDEAKLTDQLQREGEELDKLESAMSAGKQQLETLRAQIAEKKGQDAPVSKKPNAAAVLDPEAEQWLEENLGELKRGIRDQRERLQSILREAETCEQSVSSVARLRTQIQTIRNKIPFSRLALEDIQGKIKTQTEILATL